jgi:hypothetical protein
VSYVLSSNYTGSYLNTKTKLQNYETPFKEKKRRRWRGETQEATSVEKINNLAHTYPFLLHPMALHFFPLTIRLPSSVLSPGKTSFP